MAHARRILSNKTLLLELPELGKTGRGKRKRPQGKGGKIREGWYFLKNVPFLFNFSLSLLLSLPRFLFRSCYFLLILFFRLIFSFCQPLYYSPLSPPFNFICPPPSSFSILLSCSLLFRYHRSSYYYSPRFVWRSTLRARHLFARFLFSSGIVRPLVSVFPNGRFLSGVTLASKSISLKRVARPSFFLSRFSLSLIR